jgi:cytochrome c2
MNYRHYFKQTKSWLSALLIVSAFFISNNTNAQDAAKGEKLFKANCAACHRIDAKKLTGPGLQGVMDRVPSKEWLYDWVKNSQKLIASGDSYANQVYEEYAKVPMTAFEYLSNQDIDDIFEYVMNPPVKADAVAEVSSTGSDAPQQDNSMFWMIILVIVLLIVINVLTGVKKSLDNLVRAQEDKPELEDVTYMQAVKHWMKSHKTQTAVIILVLLVILAKDGWYKAKSVGVFQGYAPEQPIKFSHKIHAGDNGIDCAYCHHSAEKGKAAGIPSANVCMNCHKAISEGKRWGEEEISKIYNAVGWNPETGEYDKPQKAIKWVKIHNLPDFVYFNHSQHVVVGKQKCQTCHGEVQEIDYPMYQENDLTMGWCIDCHRKTQVKMDENPYYDKMHAELKEKYAKEGKTVFTVEDIGGLECAKCHY